MSDDEAFSNEIELGGKSTFTIQMVKNRKVRGMQRWNISSSNGNTLRCVRVAVISEVCSLVEETRWKTLPFPFFSFLSLREPSRSFYRKRNWIGGGYGSRLLSDIPIASFHGLSGNDYHGEKQKDRTCVSWRSNRIALFRIFCCGELTSSP